MAKRSAPKTRAQLIAEYRLIGKEEFGERYNDDGPRATGLIPARLIHNDMEYTEIPSLSIASCVIFDYLFRQKPEQFEGSYEIHYIWKD